MRHSTLRASDEATAGSVMAKQERISPLSSAFSHLSLCSLLPSEYSKSVGSRPSVLRRTLAETRSNVNGHSADRASRDAAVEFRRAGQIESGTIQPRAQSGSVAPRRAADAARPAP